MEFVEFRGKTVDDAITNALVSLGTTSDQIEYEVIEKRQQRYSWFWQQRCSHQGCKEVYTGRCCKRFLNRSF